MCKHVLGGGFVSLLTSLPIRLPQTLDGCIHCWAQVLLQLLRSVLLSGLGGYYFSNRVIILWQGHRGGTFEGQEHGAVSLYSGWGGCWLSDQQAVYYLPRWVSTTILGGV